MAGFVQAASFPAFRSCLPEQRPHGQLHGSFLRRGGGLKRLRSQRSMPGRGVLVDGHRLRLNIFTGTALATPLSSSLLKIVKPMAFLTESTDASRSMTSEASKTTLQRLLSKNTWSRNDHRAPRSSFRTHAVNADVEGAPGTLQNIKAAIHLAVSLGVFLALDNSLKKCFAAAAIRFPSALCGMFSIFIILLIFDSVKPEVASAVVDFFAPATTFIQRWLPLFYVPSLVVLPLAVKGIPAPSAAKIGAILGVGWAASLAVAGYTAMAVRKMVNTQMMPAEPMAKAAPFSRKELWSWTALMLLSFFVAVASPTAFGTIPLTTLPFLLAATVVGYIMGSGFPPAVKKVLHPIITCAIMADLAALAFGLFSGFGFDFALGAYLTKKAGNPGAGDILMGFLGSVILSFAFSMFKQRKLVKRHWAEIFSAIGVSSIFSLYSTAAVGRLVGLDPALTIAIVPRCITVALALSIASLFEVSNPSITAAVVVLTGLVGANFAQTLMDRLGLKDPIARGIATASSAHGLGTAALSAKEPEALPFCAIAYALTGIFSSVLCSIPVVQRSLLVMTGL